MRAKDNTLLLLADRKDLTAEEVKRLDAVMRRVAWVESKMDPTAEQSSGGPGRGKYQFELGESTKTLQQRLRNFEKTYGDTGLSAEDREALAAGDASKISEDGQDALVLVDWTMKTPGDEVGELARGEYDPKYFWATFHWAGETDELPKKLDQWDGEMSDYERMGYGRGYGQAGH